jgi:hypothetical protein
VASAIHYFGMFWGQISLRVAQRRRDAEPGKVILEPKKNPQDVPTP